MTHHRVLRPDEITCESRTFSRSQFDEIFSVSVSYSKLGLIHRNCHEHHERFRMKSIIYKKLNQKD